MKVSNTTRNAEDRALDDLVASDQRRAAMAYFDEAFAEAMMAGIDPDCFANAALRAGLQHLVDSFGEEAVAKMAETLPALLRTGEYSAPLWH